MLERFGNSVNTHSIRTEVRDLEDVFWVLGTVFGAIGWGIMGYIYGALFFPTRYVTPSTNAVIFAVIAGFLGGGAGAFLGKYMLRLNPVSLPIMASYKILMWYSSPKQEIERTKSSLRKCEEKIKRKVLLSILDEGRMLNDEELVAENLELSRLAQKSRALALEITDDVHLPIKSAVDQIQCNYLEYIHTNGTIDISNAAKELGITELQLVNILNYSLKSGLVNGHFTSDGKGFKTKEYVALRLKEKLA
jgi:hypothetical protein